MTSIIFFPLDKKLILIMVLAAVENIFNFIFKVVINFDRWRGR